jgi:hypothetical protein
VGFSLDDYNTVPARIVEFRDKYPDGRLRQKEIQFLNFAGKDWVVFTAQALRTPDDPAPAEGTAWEPVPGKTQFTRDSELQNAETAAWGRAIVAALAADTTKGIASQEEVRNRQSDAAVPPAPTVDPVLSSEWIETLEAATSVAQLQAAWDGAGAAGVTRDPKVIAAKDKRKAALNV